TTFTAMPAKASPELTRDASSDAVPKRSSPSGLRPEFLGFLGPYRRPSVPQLFPGDGARLNSLVRDGKLYLTLHDAIALAIENNLDVEVSRYSLLLADTDLTRAQGGGNLRGIDYTVQQPPPGVGATTAPLLITQTTGNPSSTNATVTDLSQVTLTGGSTQENLSQNGTSTYSAGPAIPLYDPTLTGQAGYLRRSDQTSLVNLGTDTGTSGPQSYVSTGIDYQQG